MKLRSFPNLDGLVGLARTNSVDIRPTLLHVLTELYLQKPFHTYEEERHYTELALRLIDVVDVGVRAAVAERLASYPAAPLPILHRLAGEMPDVAAPIPGKSASSTNLEQPVITGTSAEDGGSLSGGHHVPSDENTSGMDVTGEAVHHESHIPIAHEITDLSEIFFSADAEERRLILINLDYAPIAPAKMVIQPSSIDAIHDLEHAALSHDAAEFVRILAEALAISREQAARLVRDSSGEPMIVAAKSLDMPSAILQRIILFLNPAIGHSVQRVHGLARLYDEISADAARRLLSIWRDSNDQDRNDNPRHATSLRNVQYQPLHFDDQKTNAREAAMPSPRRPGAASAAPHAMMNQRRDQTRS